MKICQRLIIACFMWAGFLCGCDRAGHEANPRTLRVVTWNLQWFPGGEPGASKELQDKHVVEVREAIRKIAPDIILLEEVGSEKALQETLKPLGEEWKVAVISNFKQGNLPSGQQVAIAAKMPADLAWSEPWAKGWADAPRGYSFASFLIGGKRLAIYAVHLKSNLGDAAANTSKREDGAEQLVKHIAEQDKLTKFDAIIVGGDFNTDDPTQPNATSPGEKTFGTLKQSGLSWSFEGIPLADRITCPKKGRYPPACFDQIFTKGLGSPRAKVIAEQGSDHLPVAVDISF